MNRLIIITGDLASGKSTLANALSRKLFIPCLLKDTMKEILADEIGFTDRKENKRLSHGAVNEMIYCFEQSAKVGADMILEANFHTMEMALLNRLAHKYNYQVCLIVLTADKKLLYERFMARVPTRHRAHLSIGLTESFEKFEEYIDESRKEDVVFPINRIDITDLKVEQVQEEAIKILKNYSLI